MHFVAIENVDTGEIDHLVGPFEYDAACDWLRDFVEAYDYDEDFVAVVTTTTPDDPDLKEWYA